MKEAVANRSVVHPRDRRSTDFDSWAKRLLDVVVALTLLILLGPLMIVVALLVSCADGGPAIFWQRRVGQGGREFWFPKFRSMHLGAEAAHEALVLGAAAGDITLKLRSDPRITPIGRILRRWSIDELPQLWSVLAGEMSMVGPRPALPCEVARYSPSDLRRLAVQPGITCIWQVSGRSELPFERQVELDLDYVEGRRLSLDIKLILLTVPAVLSCRGAY